MRGVKLMKSMEQVLDGRNVTIEIHPELLVSYSTCKYKAALNVENASCQSANNEITDVFKEHKRTQLKEEWCSTNDGAYHSFNGTLSSSDDFHALSGSIFGNVHLTFNKLQCDIDGIEIKCLPGGLRTYFPILITSSTRPSKFDRTTLALASIIIRNITGVLPKRGVLISVNSEQRIKINFTSEILAIEKIIPELRRMINADKETYFRLNNHCPECAFFSSCRKKAVELDHLSLLGGITEKELKRLNGKGIFSVKQLSYTFRPRRSRNASGSVKNNYALRALAIREGKTYIVQRPRISVNDTLVLLDIVGLPDRDFVYMIGIIIIKGGQKTVFQFWADTKNDEEKIWRQFVEVIEQLEDFVIFHHGNYDSIFVKKMLVKCGNLNVNLSNNRLINTLSLLYGKVYFPVYSNGLKEIGAFLGFKWSDENASGFQCIAWRLHWEEQCTGEYKDRILKYNREDCEALLLLVAQMKKFGEEPKSDFVIMCESLKRRNLYKWGKNTFAFPELEFANKCSYFDYQREKIYWRTNDEVKKSQRIITMRSSHKPRINKVIISARPRKCPACASKKVSKHRKLSRTIYDLKYSPSGVKRWIVNYMNHRFICQICRKTFYPEGHPKTSERFGRGLLAWTVYQNIGLRQSQENVGKGLNDIFGYHFNWRSVIPVLKRRAAKLYRSTYEEILSSIKQGELVHVDETSVSVKGSTAYVWVFTNLNEVAYVYSPTREGTILGETLREFHGVLVSDFFPVYESIQCEQQRCLVHLIRDLNDDLFKNQFDLEYKLFAQKFAELLKPIIMTIDQFGLTRRHLSKHKQSVERFFKNCVDCEGDTELTRKYQARFAKNRNRLFTFLDYDGIPWNNNNAENAIKGFATMRRVIGGSSTEKGLNESLMLLSICQTLRNKGCSSLAFFRSGETSLKQFLKRYR